MISPPGYPEAAASKALLRGSICAMRCLAQRGNTNCIYIQHRKDTTPRGFKCTDAPCVGLLMSL